MIFDHMRERASITVEKIHQLPFNIELANGSLSQEKFIFYLIQDAIYLAEFSKALAITATKLTDKRMAGQFMALSKAVITEEQMLHTKYIQLYYSLEKFSIIEPTPACFMYTNYLLKIASTATVEESVASLLPCFWIYREVYKKIALFSDRKNNPYLDWINLYSGEEFDLSVERVIDTVNKLGITASDQTKENMIKSFLKSTQLEWLFWNSAYHQEKWLI